MDEFKILTNNHLLSNFDKEWVRNVNASVYKPNVDGRTDDRQRTILKPHLSNQAKNVFTRKTAPGSHVFQRSRTIFKLNSRIWAKNVLTKFHENWSENVTSGETNVLTKFHEDWTKNLTSTVFTCFHYIHIREHCHTPWWPYINKTNVLTKFHDDWAKIVTSIVFTRKTAPPTGGLSMKCDFYRIIGTNLLTKFHEDWTRNVASRGFTRKTAPRTGACPSFKLDRGIIGTNLLTKFHEDGTKSVAYECLQSNVDGRRTDRRMDGQRTDKDRSQKLT
ncbi:hypothetical protein DPMN_097260 [Dreissena polymorpha]|uniref:Uncharacterized protein n=1 Tax=Dreissena polymorpha TaxID=45954 RepID=A0A9D4LCZ1_DREPO|nr:hypothetical protein DPMN_097260 [Dreissena polymorpha]